MLPIHMVNDWSDTIHNIFGALKGKQKKYRCIASKTTGLREDNLNGPYLVHKRMEQYGFSIFLNEKT